MDIQKYIESGILEEYAVGMLQGKALRDVEQNIEKYPEIRNYVESIQDNLEQYLNQYSTPLEADQRNRILQAVKENAPQSRLAQEASSLARSRRNWTWALLGALTIFGLTTLFTTMRYRADYNDIVDRYQQLSADCDTIRQQLNQLQNNYAIISDGQFQRVLMTGTANAPNATATVYNNAATQQTFLNILQLDAPPSGRQYQLWAIVNGAPTDMGVFDLPSDDSIIEVPFIPDAEAFAITLEPTGGNPTPNLDQMVLIGNIG